MSPFLPGQFFREIVDEPGDKKKTKVIGYSIAGITNGMIHLMRYDGRRTASLESIPREELTRRLEMAEIAETSAPIRPLVTLRDDMSEGLKNAILEEQVKRHALIQPLLDLKDDLFDEPKRTEAMKAIANKKAVTVPYLWQLLCLWWQLGCKPEALRPRHTLAGQKALKERIKCLIEEGADESQFKVYKTGPEASPDAEDRGMPMDKIAIRLCWRGAMKFLYVPTSDHSLTIHFLNAYTKTCRQFFDHDNNPNAPAPSLGQFRRAIEAHPNHAKNCRKIVGPLAYKTTFRQTTGTTSEALQGPGHLLEFDDVNSKVVAIDEFGRPMGPCNLFVGVDSWDGCGVGVAATLTRSSLAGAKDGLLACFADKREYATERRLKINFDAIPCSGVYRRVIADNGPLGGSSADVVSKDLCDLENPPSKRPDWKPGVESSFNGYLRQNAQRCAGYTRVKDSDPPGTVARLPLKALEQLAWNWLAFYNTRVRTRLPSQELLRENPDLPQSPCEIHRAGLEMFSGRLQHRSIEELHLKLLEEDEVTLTARRGIAFKGLIYFVEGARGAELVQQAFLKQRSRPTRIRYSKLFTPHIFVQIDEKLYRATLRKDDMREFGHLTFLEVEHRLRKRKPALTGTKERHRVAREQLDRDIDAAHAEGLAVINQHFKSPLEHKRWMKGIGTETARAEGVRGENHRKRQEIGSAIVNRSVNSDTRPRARRKNESKREHTSGPVAPSSLKTILSK